MFEGCCAFDLEISAQIPPNCKDWWSLGELGVTCAAAAMIKDGNILMPAEHWWAGMYRQFSEGYPNGFAERMDIAELGGILSMLALYSTRPIITWNGLGFDYRVIAQALPSAKKVCVTLAMEGYDLGLQMYAELGFMGGLDKVAKSLGLAGKSSNTTGASATSLWRVGQQQRVIDYCINDAITTSQVALALEDEGRVSWRGYRGTVEWIFKGPKTGAECLRLIKSRYAENYTWPISKFTEWME